MKLYNSIIETKNSMFIPVFTSGKTLESRYNPQNEAEKKILNQNIQSNIILIFGIGSGLFIKSLAEKYKNIIFLAAEFSTEDINFLSQLDTFKDLYKLENVIIFSIEELETILLKHYLPSFYGNLQLIEQRAWIDEINSRNININLILQNTLKKISADFSVQTHFGNIWQKNIISNIKNCEKSINYKEEIDLTKEAVIVAAGPSLDETSEYLKKTNPYIISTDTAFQTLVKNEIIPNMVVSIDGQNISSSHFLIDTKNYKTIFVFDLCGNSSAASKIINNKNKIFFINSGHPLINTINNVNENCIPHISAGSGTVTIAGFDLAVKMGFKKIKILGADFSYINGKTYTKGTYLDSLYLCNSNKFESFEKKFNKLLFRTELIKIGKNSFTTEILESYRFSLEKYLENYELNFKKSDNIYDIVVENNNKTITIEKQKICFDKCLNELKKGYDLFVKGKNITLNQIHKLNLSGLLPFIAFLRMKNKNSFLSISEFIELAYKKIFKGKI